MLSLQAFFISPSTSEMSQLRNEKLKVELIWWIFTTIIVIAVLIPIWRNVPSFPFFAENIFFIAAFVTFTRYIFLLPTTLIAKSKWIKVFIIAISAILFFVMTTGLGDFHNFLEERGLQTLVTHLHVTKQTSVINYIKSEMIFFGVASIIAGLILPIRMIVSLWRMRNRGTV
jgi:hypothetical protein